jgi:hypothetical protein
MSDATVLQTAANRFASPAGFAPIAVDGRIGSKTLDAARRALGYLKNSSDVEDSTIDEAAEWLSVARDTSALAVNASAIGRFLNHAADAENLPHVAGPTPTPAPVFQPPTATPIMPLPTMSASILDRWRMLATWQKIALGALAGALLIFLHGRYKRSRGLSGSTSTLHLFTYKNKHGSYSDVWAHDAEHAREQIKRKKDRPSGFYSISRVTNVPARKVA